MISTRKLHLTERLAFYREARDLYKKAFNQCQITEKLGISRGTVQGWLTRGCKPGREYEPKTKVDITKVKEIAYLVGVVDSDGWLGQYERVCMVELQTTDEDFASEFKKAIKAITDKDAYISRKKRRSHIHNGVLFKDQKTPIVASICSRELYEVLRNPEEYINASPEAYIRGFADGDGTICRDGNGCYRIRLFNKDLVKLQTIRNLLSKIGIDSHIRAINRRTLYALEINKRTAVRKFVETIGFSIKRKQQKWSDEKPTYAKNKKYYQENKQRLLEYQQKYRKSNYERILKRGHAYYQSHREHILNQKKQYYRQNHQRILSQKAQYYQRTKERQS